MSGRDIFATSKWLGHSRVNVTEKHYAGLIQSLQVEYSNKYEATLNAKLQLSCNFQTKPDQSRLMPKNKKTSNSRREMRSIESGTDETRTRDLRLDRPEGSRGSLRKSVSELNPIFV